MKTIFLNLPDNQLDTIPLLDIVKKIEKKSVSSDRIEDIGEDVDFTRQFQSMRVEKLKKVMNLISPALTWC